MVVDTGGSVNEHIKDLAFKNGVMSMFKWVILCFCEVMKGKGMQDSVAREQHSFLTLMP